METCFIIPASWDLSQLGLDEMLVRMKSTRKVLNPAWGVGHRVARRDGAGGGQPSRTHQQCMQLCSVVGEEPGRLLAQLTDLGDLQGDGMSDVTVTWDPGPRQHREEAPKASGGTRILPSLTWA